MSSNDRVTIPIEKNFYELVEQKNYLKHIIYGDSVVGTGRVLYEMNGIINRDAIENIWKLLIEKKYEIEVIDNKEYIFFKNDEFKIQNYDIVNDNIYFAVPRYLMRHRYSGMIYHNYLNNELNVATTMNHSYVEADIKNRTFRTRSPDEIQFLPVINGINELRVPQKFALMYGIESKYDYHGIVKKTKSNKQVLFSIRPYKICKKGRTPDFDGYVYDFEVPETHIFIVDNVLVHNTDSLFIEIPRKPDTVVERVKIVHQAAEDINDLIIRYNKEYLLPRCGFSPDRNETNFKEEMCISSMIMMDVKKSYAYKLVASEAVIDPETNQLVGGKIFDTPLIKKKSGLGVKTDTIDLTKEILDYLINVALDDAISTKDKYQEALKELKRYHDRFIDGMRTLNVSLIGTPVRWQKKINAINAMKLYNCVVENVFQYLSNGHLIYCKFNNLQAFKKFDDLPIDKLNAIAIPPKNNVELIRNAFSEYGITFDVERQWNNVFNKTCHRILAGLKETSSSA